MSRQARKLRALVITVLAVVAMNAAIALGFSSDSAVTTGTTSVDKSGIPMIPDPPRPRSGLPMVPDVPRP